MARWHAETNKLWNLPKGGSPEKIWWNKVGSHPVADTGGCSTELSRQKGKPLTVISLFTQKDVNYCWARSFLRSGLYRRGSWVCLLCSDICWAPSHLACRHYGYWLGENKDVASSILYWTIFQLPSLPKPGASQISHHSWLLAMLARVMRVVAQNIWRDWGMLI